MRARAASAASAAAAIVIVAAMVVAVGALGACGDADDRPSDEDAIRTTLRTYLGATARGDGRAACAQLADAARRDLVRSVRGATGCGDAVSRYRAGLTTEQRAQLRVGRVTAVHVDGDRATAKVLGGAESGRLERRGGRWLIAGR